MRILLPRAPQLSVSSLTIVLFFIFCQVIGGMCALPDVSLADDQTMISEQGMICPMDSDLMCPASLTSSPDRQVKVGSALNTDHLTIDRSSNSAVCILLAAWSGVQTSSLQPTFPSSPSIQVLRI